jgi:hypothetical protein
MLIYEFEDLLVTPRLLAKRYTWKQGRRQDGGWDPPEKGMRRSDLHWVSILSTIRLCRASGQGGPIRNSG